MRIRLGFILLQFLMFVLPAKAQRSMGPNEFMALVQKNHPIAIQAKLTLDKANAELMAARGAFDPKANTAFSEKQFNNTTYWNTLDSYLKLPAWIGEFKGGYERSGGKYLNPEDVVDEGGLYYASYTLPLGAGLFFDERRNALKQAKVYVTMSEAEQRAMLNKLMYKALGDYWNWYYTKRQLQFVNEGLRLAEVRFEAIRELYINGSLSALDTLEAYGNLLSRRNQLNQALAEEQNALLAVNAHIWNNDQEPAELEADILPTMPEADVLFRKRPLKDSLYILAATQHPDIIKLEGSIRQMEFEKKFRTEMLKPQVNISYNFLRGTLNNSDEGDFLFLNNYKFGLDASMPLFLRKERGKLRSTKIMLNWRHLDLTQNTRNIRIGIDSRWNELNNFYSQLQNQRAVEQATRALTEGEQTRFLNGESSVFLVNTRETNLVNAGLKLAELEMKFAKSIAYLYFESGIYLYSY
jgi:outer membrane protein TolC